MKLYAQMPVFLNVLKSLPTPLDLHVAVTTTDMGAPGDVTAADHDCTAQGDNGAFQSAPRGTCASTTLMNGATYLADDGNGTANFTDPMASVLQCISMVGDSGCGFRQPLAAAAHALGADNVVNGVPDPSGDERRVSATGRLSGHHFPRRPGRLLGPRRNRALLAQRRGAEPGQPARADRALPLQPVRAPLQGPGFEQPAGAHHAAAQAAVRRAGDGLEADARSDRLPGQRPGDGPPDTGQHVRLARSRPSRPIRTIRSSSPRSRRRRRRTPSPGSRQSGGQNTQPGELWPEIEHSCGAEGRRRRQPRSDDDHRPTAASAIPACGSRRS